MKKYVVIPLHTILIMGINLLFFCSCELNEENSKGNIEEEQQSDFFTDPRDGNVYKTIKIGNQVWMAENLKYLPTVTESEISSKTNPCYYVYGYYETNVAEAKNTSNYNTYGVLYNWPAAINSCPDGWHLPSYEEWKELRNYFDVDERGHLKSTGTLESNTGLWLDPNKGATNLSGFTALPGGYHSDDFYSLNQSGHWWSTKEVNDHSAYYWYMTSYESDINSFYLSREMAFSVRCVRN